MEELKKKKPGGKREGQKYKSLLVWDILLKKTDENHALQLKDIKEHLSHYGITAERHSIKRDIDDILARLNEVTGLQNRGVFVRSGLYVLRKTAMPATLLELGFITNPSDAALMNDNPNLFATGIYQGILDYFNLSA